MGLQVTKQDRKRIFNTALVFGIIFVICAVLAGIFIGIMPRAKDITAIGKNNEKITSLMEGHDGSTFFIQSANWVCEYDAVTGEQISEFNITDEISKKLASDGKTVVANSLDQWTISAMVGETGNYFIAYDANGNIFKLERNKQGKLEVQSDYYLIQPNGNSYTSREIKGVDHVGDRMFALHIEKGFFYIDEYDLANISQGSVNRKFLWDVGMLEEDGYKQIEAVKANTGVVAFYAHKDHILLVKKGGDIIRVSTDLIDTRYGDGLEFFSDAKRAIESGLDQDTYDEVYEREYRKYLVEDLIANWYNKMTAQGKVFVVKGQEITSADAIRALQTGAEVLAVYSENGIRQTAISGADTKAKDVAKAAADSATAVDYGWFKKYDEVTMSLYVKEECFDNSCYSAFGAGESTINGMIYSKKNNAIYYADASDGYLYVLKSEDLAKAPRGSFVSDVAQKIESIHCGEGQTFSDFGNGLGYNKFANTLYLKFANERQVTIVDINDMNNYKVLHEYTGSFDMFSLTGNEDNSVTHTIHQVVKVDKKGVEYPRFYVCTYEPERFENKTLITVLFVIFASIAVITFIVSAWLLLTGRTEKGIAKIKVIAKDTKKNKYVYLALVFYVAVLIMFCYYEAIGAIAMSFFNYTKEKPAWIWNDFANYVRIFNDSSFWPSVLNMLFFLVSDLILSIVPPIIFAILLILIRNNTASNWIRSLMFIPSIIPSIASMLIWRVGIYGNEGILNQIISGEVIEFLYHKSYARWSLILMGFPFVGGYLIFYGGMMNIPKEYHEAGKLEGLGTIKRFLKIDIPLIMPQIKYIFITTFIGSVQNFARTHILNSTVVKTPVQTMYEMMTREGDYGMSSAYATLIFLFLFVAIATNFKMQKQDAMGADL